MKVPALWAGSLLLLVGGCESTTAPRSESAFTLEADEARIWERSHEIIDIIRRSGLVVDDPQATKYLESICKNLYPEVDKHPSEFAVLILRDPSVNAFVLPNGVMCVNTGLLSAMESEAQLAMVLGHELSHFHLRHGVEGFRHLKSQAAFHTIFSVSTLGYGSLISMIGLPAALSGHSKEAERAADRLGWEWYLKAGYAKEEAHLSFVQLKRYTEKNPEKEPAFFASHPKLDERIAEIKKLSSNPGQLAAEPGIVGVQNLLEPLNRLWIENALLDVDLGNLDRVQLLIDRFSNYDESRSNPGYFYAKAELARRQGLPGADEHIIEICREGLISDAKHAGLLRASGQAHYRLGNWETARQQLTEATLLDPNFPKNPFLLTYVQQCEEHLSQ